MDEKRKQTKEYKKFEKYTKLLEGAGGKIEFNKEL